MCAESRAVTNPALGPRVVTTPVLVKNIERQWNKRSPRGMTAMGVGMRKGAECVGVMVPVTIEQLADFDEREKGYDRVQIPIRDVEPVPFLDVAEHYSHPEQQVFLKDQNKTGKMTSKSRFWVYVPRKSLEPTPEYPIVQSYLDTILRGCLSISEDFAVEFLRSTKGWDPAELTSSDESSDEEDDGSETSGESPVWVNDRKRPIYPRGDSTWSHQKAATVDSLLEEHLTEDFESREPI